MLSDYSWPDILCWLIGLLVIFEVIVYVAFTYGRKLFESKKTVYKLEETPEEDSTASRIARIDELDEASYENNEFHEVSDEDLEVREAVEDEPLSTATAGGVEAEESTESEGEGEAEEDNLPPNIETETMDDDLTAIEQDFEAATEEVFYTDEEIEAMGFGLFGDEAVVENDVLGREAVTDSGYLPKVNSQVVKTGNEGTGSGKNRITFEGSKKLDLEAIQGDLDKIRKETSARLEGLAAEVDDEDDTPLQETPD